MDERLALKGGLMREKIKGQQRATGVAGDGWGGVVVGEGGGGGGGGSLRQGSHAILEMHF